MFIVYAIVIFFALWTLAQIVKIVFAILESLWNVFVLSCLSYFVIAAMFAACILGTIAAIIAG